MPVYKDDKRDTWYSRFEFKDWQGVVHGKWKRGFATKRAAVQWEADVKREKSGSLDMRFGDFVNIYLTYLEPRVKQSTLIMKEFVIRDHIIPYFGDKKLSEITANDVLLWQNTIMACRNRKTGKLYRKSYLKTIHNQLTCILNFAVRFYKLPSNAARIVGNMGTDKGIEMKFWTLDQYRKFSDAMMDEPRYYYIFEILYWGGLREGEALALTLGDIDFEGQTISVSKTFHVFNGKEVITSPKTDQSVRTVTIPSFLCDELNDYIKMVYGLNPTERLFSGVSKSMLTRAIHRGAEKAGLPEIRVHDLRHSHVSLLIQEGFTPLAIGKRVGHKSIDITYRYAHLFPSVQNSIADKLNEIGKEDSDVGKKQG